MLPTDGVARPMPDVSITTVITAIISFLSVVAKVLIDRRDFQQAQRRVLEAEREAFAAKPGQRDADSGELQKSQDQLEKRANNLHRTIERAESRLRAGVLFDLYNKQIEKYQTETQQRASWSFFVAILAMAAGLGFVMWGGTVVLTGENWKDVAAGSAVSTIGGTISAFITKTFLDVHRLSLSQLNRYFRQPVVNSHVLTAQRIAEQIDDADTRRSTYARIALQVTAMIQDVDGQVETVRVESTARDGVEGKGLPGADDADAPNNQPSVPVSKH